MTHRHPAERTMARRAIGDRADCSSVHESVLLRHLRFGNDDDFNLPRCYVAQPDAQRSHQILLGKAGSDNSVHTRNLDHGLSAGLSDSKEKLRPGPAQEWALRNAPLRAPVSRPGRIRSPARRSRRDSPRQPPSPRQRTPQCGPWTSRQEGLSPAL